MSSMQDLKGFPYQGYFEIEEGKGYVIRFEREQSMLSAQIVEVRLFSQDLAMLAKTVLL